MPQLGPFNHLDPDAPKAYWKRLWTERDLSESLDRFRVDDFSSHSSFDDASEDFRNLDPYYRDRDSSSSLGYTYDPDIAQARFRDMRNAYREIYDSMRSHELTADPAGTEFNRRYGTGRYFFDNSESPFSFWYRLKRYAKSLPFHAFVDNSSPSVREELVPVSYSRIEDPGFSAGTLRGTFPSYPNNFQNTSFTTRLLNRYAVGDENVSSPSYSVDLIRDAANAFPNWALRTFLGKPLGVSSDPNPLSYRSFAQTWFNSLPYNGSELVPSAFDQLEKYKAFGADLTGSYPLSQHDHESTIGVDKLPPELALVPSFATWSFLNSGDATQLGVVLGLPLSLAFKYLGKGALKADVLYNRVLSKIRASRFKSWLPSVSEELYPGIDSKLIRAASDVASSPEAARSSYKAARNAILRDGPIYGKALDLNSLSDFNSSYFGPTASGRGMASAADSVLSSLGSDSGSAGEFLIRALKPVNALSSVPSYLDHFSIPLSGYLNPTYLPFSTATGLGTRLIFPSLYFSSANSAQSDYSKYADWARFYSDILSQPVNP